jgi:hypothetical protein
MTDATTETEQPPPCRHRLESYRNYPYASAYEFDVPFGTWRARLDHKARGKSSNIILYVTEIEVGAKYWLSVFWGDGFAARDRKINFEYSGEVGEVFEFTIKPTKTGNRALMAARKVSPDDPPLVQSATTMEAPNLAAEQGRADSAPTLAPKVEKPAPRKPRLAWGRKYADLSPPPKE